MTVKVDDRRKEYDGNDVATVFNGPMAYSASHIQAWLIDIATNVATQVPGSAFDVDRIGRQNGTRVIMDTAPPTGQKLLLLRVVPIAQTVDITNQGDFNASVLETMGDLLAMQIQQLLDGQNHKIGIPETSLGNINTTLPPPVPSVLWGWDDTAQAARYYTLAELANFIAYGDKVVIQFLGVAQGVDGVNQDFPLGQDPGSLGNLAVEIDGVGQKNGIDFTYSGTNLHFTSPPPSGAEIQIRFDQAVPVGTGLSSSIFYTPPSTGTPGSVQSFLDLLWNAGANAGAKLLRWVQAGIGAIARTIEDRLRETIHLKDFGDVSTSAAATATLKRAIVWAQTTGAPKTIRLPYGTMGITEPIVVTGPVRIEGEGGGYYAWQGHADDNVTNLIWAGGITSEPMFKFQNNNFGGAGISRVLVNCNGGPGNQCNGVYYENSVGTLNEQLGVFGFVDYGIKMNGVGSTCSWNSFINLNVEESSNGKCCIWLAGSPASNGNACHNVFTNTRVVHAGNRHGVYLGGCDNNLFDMLLIYRAPGGTGRGVICDFTESAPFPNGNTFSHAQLGDGGYFEPAAGRGSSSRPAAVFWPYQTDNGQPFPIHTDGARTPMMDDTGALQGINSIGKHTYMGANWKFNAIYGPADGTVIAVAFPNGAVSSVDYNIVANIGDLKTWCINAKSVNGFNLVINSAFAGPTYCEFLVLGG